MLGKIGILDLCVIGFYFVSCLVVALWRSKKINNIREYTLGTGKIGTCILVCTIFATDIGAGATMGVASKIYSMGLFFVIVSLFSPLFWLSISIIFSDVSQFKGCISISDIMYELYGETGRWATNFCSVVLSICTVGVQAIAVGLMLHYFLDIDKVLGAVLGIGVLTVYSALGGIRAVTLTDALQFAIFYVTIPLTCFWALNDMGGISEVWKKLPESHTTLDLSGHNLYLFISMIIFMIIPETSGTYMQRFLMSGDPVQIRKAVKIVLFLSFPIVITMCLIGLMMATQQTGLYGDSVFITFVDNHLAYGVKGLMIAAMVAVIMSTADSWLNTTSVLLAHDICKRMFPTMKDKTELLIARIATLLMGTLAIVTVWMDQDILDIIWTVNNFWDPLVLVPVAAGFLKFRTTHISYISGACIGIAFTGYAAYLDQQFDTISCVAGLVGSGVGLFGAHYIQLLIGVKMPRRDAMLKQIAEEQKFQAKKPNILFRLISSASQLSPSKILDSTTHRTKRFKSQFELSSLGLMLCCALPLIMDTSLTLISQGSYLIPLYILYIMLGLLICLREYWLQVLREHFLSLSWYLLTFVALPLSSITILLISGGTMFWALHYVMCMFLMSVFLDYASFLFLNLLAFLVAIPLSFVLPPIAPWPPLSFPSVPIFAIPAVAFLIFSYFKHLQEISMGEQQILTAKLAHELRNPIFSIQSGLELLSIVINNIREKKCKDTEKDFDQLQDITNNMYDVLKRGSNTLDMFLSKARGEKPSDIGIHSIRACILDVLENYKFNPDALDRIEIITTNDFQFSGSRFLVKHVFLNILNNSLRYAGQDIPIEISITNYKVRIKDYGKGIPKEQLPYIFDTLYTQERDGTGLGLAYCKEIMECLGGSIHCSSEVGQYTIFVLSFPPLSINVV
ncbi:hypothetical protein EDM53_03645 [Rickettsiales endosymbiont of Peranema trichophorum]|uniref:sodium:solute symporter family transporter n=1 Tax=Rickettsiales endosymbiont of Peranema trichophorum TaxID=2486577 RepID=UPI001023777A|nr:ATP-binding protein [Rickettsiales endosymbiont of Peranema trichophorum]RZI46767.1 hypothetical protein EDM53_03645 [Rickettsiales endosymbiont of Peranema trichophorum]